MKKSFEATHPDQFFDSIEGIQLYLCGADEPDLLDNNTLTTGEFLHWLTERHPADLAHMNLRPARQPLTAAEIYDIDYRHNIND